MSTRSTGPPGVYSARYAGEECSYEDNNRKLLRELGDVPEEQRGAHFLCTIACASVPTGDGDAEPRVLFTVVGRVDGRIAHAARGDAGFGYDPVFIESRSGRTFGEMSAREKDGCSHRGDALRQLVERFRALTG